MTVLVQLDVLPEVCVELDPPDAIITPLVEPNAASRTLFCEKCGWVTHTFTKHDGQKFYVCDCGIEIMYFVVRPTK